MSNSKYDDLSLIQNQLSRHTNALQNPTCVGKDRERSERIVQELQRQHYSIATHD